MESVPKLDDDGINRLGEPLVDKQLPDQAVLLVEPMRLAERDHRRGLEERQYAVVGGDRNRLKTGVVAHGVVVADERKSTPRRGEDAAGSPPIGWLRYGVQSSHARTRRVVHLLTTAKGTVPSPPASWSLPSPLESCCYGACWDGSASRAGWQDADAQCHRLHALEASTSTAPGFHRPAA
jgi:hypothetical protein